MNQRVVHKSDCACERCVRYHELERREQQVALQQIACRQRGPFPWVRYVDVGDLPAPTPKQYRRSHDGTLKPVVSKGCRGCHQKQG